MLKETVMVFVPEPIIVLNLVLCVVILLLGYLVYRKRDIISALFIGIAFGIFGLSHLNTLFDPPLFPEVTFALLRICGYLIVAAALYLLLTE
jgi:4-amino-4-deoxy-L-arabinose transferase-like glycosyltransferase